MHEMMNGWHGGFGLLHGAVMLLLLVLLVLGIAALIKYLFRR